MIRVHEMKGFIGTDWDSHPAQLPPQILSHSKNTWMPTRGVLGKRPGSKKLNTIPVTPFSSAVGLIRFYLTSGTKKTVVAIADTGAVTTRFYDFPDGGGAPTTLSGGTAYTKTTHVGMAVYNDVLYMCNGENTLLKWTGSGAMADVDTGQWPAARRGRYLKIYRERLLMGGGVNNPGNVWFSATFSAEGSGATNRLYVGDKDGDFITGLGLIGAQTDTTGIKGQLAVLKNTSVWILDGDPAVNGVLEKASDRIGCASGKTAVETPYGLIFMGHDDVYLMQARGEPIKIGRPIRPKIAAIPAAQRANACATYQNGYYKLWITTSGGTQNKESYWLDLRGFPEQIGWFGPMTNVTGSAELYSFAFVETLQGDDIPQTLNADVSEAAIAIDDGRGQLMWLDTTLFDDQGTAIQMQPSTQEFAADSPYIDKFFMKHGGNFRADGGEVITLETALDDGAATASQAITLSATGSLWDVASWDTGVFGGTFYKQVTKPFSRTRRATKAKMTVTHSNATDMRIESLQLGYEISKRILEHR